MLMPLLPELDFSLLFSYVNPLQRQQNFQSLASQSMAVQSTAVVVVLAVNLPMLFILMTSSTSMGYMNAIAI